MAALSRDRYCLQWCAAVKDLVAFHRDGVNPATIPMGFLPYSEGELAELFGGDKGITSSRLRLIHAAKVQGGRVVGNGGP